MMARAFSIFNTTGRNDHLPRIEIRLRRQCGHDRQLDQDFRLA